MFDQYKDLIEVFSQIFESKERRILGLFFVFCIFLTTIIDSIDGIGPLSPWGVVCMVVGGGGGALFVGLNLLRFLPERPIVRWQLGGIAILLIFGGLLSLVLGIAGIWLD